MAAQVINVQKKPDMLGQLIGPAIGAFAGPAAGAIAGPVAGQASNTNRPTGIQNQASNVQVPEIAPLPAQDPNQYGPDAMQRRAQNLSQISSQSRGY